MTFLSITIMSYVFAALWFTSSFGVKIEAGLLCNGILCPGHATCIDKKCACLEPYVEEASDCIDPLNNIKLSKQGTFGSKTCRTQINTLLGDLRIQTVAPANTPWRHNFGQKCTVTVLEDSTTTFSVPANTKNVDNGQTDAPIAQIKVDFESGKVSYHDDATNLYLPCSPNTQRDTATAQLIGVVYRYSVRCVDSRGHVSNNLSITVEVPGCNVVSKC